MRFRVVCDAAQVRALDARTADVAAEAERWASGWRAWVAAADGPVQRAERAGEFRAERERRVAAGEVAFSRADLLRQALSAVIAAHGWRDRRWRPIPVGESSGPGRRWGTPTRGWETSVFVDASDADGELIRRVAYWRSEKATRALREWTQRWGRGPADAKPGQMVRTPPAEEMARRRALRNEILTVGDILREVVAQAAGERGSAARGEPPAPRQSGG